jgi:hypothetical protein
MDLVSVESARKWLVLAERRRSHFVELIESSFDEVYSKVSSGTLPEDAWQLLDHRLHRSF